MREIIFRGFCERTKSWVFGNYVKAQMLTIKEEYEHFIIETKCDGAEFLVLPETVGQYTGLKDKNGDRIFEGDVCLSSINRKFVVEFDEKNAKFLGFTIEEKERFLVYIGQEPKVEIIGNIHDKVN